MSISHTPEAFGHVLKDWRLTAEGIGYDPYLFSKVSNAMINLVSSLGVLAFTSRVEHISKVFSCNARFKKFIGCRNVTTVELQPGVYSAKYSENKEYLLGKYD